MGEDLVPAAATAVQDLSPVAREYARAIGLDDPPRQAVGMVSDALHHRRLRRQLKYVAEAADLGGELGIPPQAVPDRIVRAVLEHGADEDDPDMQTLWVHLLARASTGGSVVPAYPDILRQLEHIEARLLDAVLRVRGASPLRPLPEVTIEQLDEEFPNLEWRHLDNLERLNLLTFNPDLPGNADLPERPTPWVWLSETPLGVAFVEACRRPSNDTSTSGGGPSSP